LRSTTAYATTRSNHNMSILVRPTVPGKRSSGKNRLGKFDEARLLTDLANMRDEGIRNFRKRWGLYAERSDEVLIHRRDELQLLWRENASLVDSEWRMTEFQGRAYDGWLEHRPGYSLEELICEDWLSLDKSGLHVDWTPKMKGIRPEASSLPKVLVWACLMHAERLAVCRNLECPTPYFIANRNDQRYCSQECASPAKRAAKRKWWDENRAKDARARKIEPKKRPTGKGR
jgi:hypothetical protein